MILVVTRSTQERAFRTRRALICAAAKVFDEAGYSGAGVTRILAEAGLTHGAMYFHFKSKEELARAVMLEQASDLDLPEEPQGLQQLVDLTFMLAVELRHNRMLRAGVRLAVDPGGPARHDGSIYRWWAELFEKELLVAREKGELRPEVDEQDFALALVGAYTGTQVMSEIISERDDLPRRITALWRYVLPAVATPDVQAGLTFDGAPAGWGKRP
ncbi:ScbR family autoregulator-binding transcription factor [Streptomyces sp. NPDC050610]|uniref:ScbR family autoregulator-binding transcription factor n=1 Tax=Streptomyces sp. NPDC050610 TaxID=3157097 RepID=UPI00343E8D24